MVLSIFQLLICFSCLPRNFIENRARTSLVSARTDKPSLVSKSKEKRWTLFAMYNPRVHDLYEKSLDKS